MLSRHQLILRWSGFVCLYLMLPVGMIFAPAWIKLTFGISIRSCVIPALLVAALGVYGIGALRGMICAGDLFRLGVPCTAWRKMLLRWLFFCSLLTALLAGIDADHLFLFPAKQPRFWGIVMIAYPILSVLAQGILFRWFYDAVFAPLFRTPRDSLLAGAAVFAFTHILFLNPWAILFTFLGGILFLSSYRETGSLLFSGIEHALYGNALFTIGWGAYFYQGTVALLAN